MTHSEIVNKLQERKGSLEFQTKLHSGLISHNYIVEVGDSTVSTNDEGNAFLLPNVGAKLPSQWTVKGVEEIKNKCSWKNMLNKKMEVNAIPYKDWYKKELDRISSTLDFLLTHN